MTGAKSKTAFRPDRRLALRMALAGAAALAAVAASGGDAVMGEGTARERQGMTRDYVTDPERPWRYFSDQVMGGVSEGRADISAETIGLSGTVSTENRGGFIQVRTDLVTPLDAGSRGVALEARGNGERYFVHLRTRDARRPWHYYQAGFEAGADWAEARLPFEAFRPSGDLPRGTPRPQDITSIGLVAYGRDHAAHLEVRRLRIW